jgi:DNA ligase-associated metallophosphoesterase
MRVKINGERLTLDPSGALCWDSERTLVFADLHFEKGSSLARHGAMLPPYDTRETMARMSAAIERHRPLRIVALGDSFHDRNAAERLGEDERSTLQQLGRGREWIWIAGNHDPAPPAWLGGMVAHEIAIGGLVLRHEPQPHPQAGEVAGHLHPCATAIHRGRGIRRRCFVSDGSRMILPAFGAFTGGLDVRETPIASLFPDGLVAYMLGARRVYAASGTKGAHKLWRKSNDESQPSISAIATAEVP